MFSVERHVSSAKAEYDPNLPMRIAIDAGASRHTGAVFFQVSKMPVGWPLITVFADYLGDRHRVRPECRGHPECRYAPVPARA